MTRTLEILRVTGEELLELQDLVDSELSAGGPSRPNLLTLQRRLRQLTGEEYWPGHAALQNRGGARRGR